MNKSKPLSEKEKKDCPHLWRESHSPLRKQRYCSKCHLCQEIDYSVRPPIGRSFYEIL